jgi:anti-sigma regulatory factor (Ser/Thr protein kinase)
MAASMLQALAPARFPLRRDIEVEGGARQSPAAQSLRDFFFSEPDRFVGYVLTIGDSGVSGAARLAGLRETVRAAFAHGVDLAAILASDGTVPDLALLSIDLRTGRYRTRTFGRGRASCGDQRLPLDGILRPGTVAWLATGDIGEIAEHVPVEGLSSLTDPALGKAGHGAGLAIHFMLPRRNRPEPDETQFELTIANDVSGISAAIERVTGFLDATGVSPDDTMGLDLALDELLTNVIAYGFGDGRHHAIGLSLSVTPAVLAIEIRDDGTAFDPLSIPPPDLEADLATREVGGLGIHFARQLLDKIEYRRANGWNIVSLEKQRRS